MARLDRSLPRRRREMRACQWRGGMRSLPAAASIGSHRDMHHTALLPAALILVLLAGCGAQPEMPADKSGSSLLLYAGTYTRDVSAGIYGYRFDPTDGTAVELGLMAELRDPSFLALHPNGRFLYAVSETDDYDAAGSGSVASFAIDPVSGALTKLNQVSSRGGWPCHLSVDPSGRMLIVANYKGGSVASFPLAEDGTVGHAASFFQHDGSSVHERQQQAHAHSADFSPDGRFAFFSDLGLDQVKVYRADAQTGTLSPNDPPHVEVDPGSGPRHFAQHPAGHFAYGLNELSSTISVYSLDAETGQLAVIGTEPTLPEDFTGENYTAEIFLHPAGNLLYASNRGHDSIAIFAVDDSTGALESRGRVSTRGEWPRNFQIDPSGSFLLAANQNSDSIEVFSIERSTGGLTPTGSDLEIDAPVCLLFVPDSA